MSILSHRDARLTSDGHPGAVSEMRARGYDAAVRWFSDSLVYTCQGDLGRVRIRWRPALQDRVDATRRRAGLIFESSVIGSVDKTPAHVERDASLRA